VKGPHRLPPTLPSADREKGEEEFRRIEHELRLALSEIRFGSIEIVIQDARVVQIERREKVRFDREGREGR
jgi:hypothetical protein